MRVFDYNIIVIIIVISSSSSSAALTREKLLNLTTLSGVATYGSF